MRNQFAVSCRPCCYCTDCCGGSSPSEYDCTINWTDDECKRCNEDVGGSFVLSDVGGCAWQYFAYDGSFPAVDCRDPAGTPYADFFFISQRVRLEIHCIDATHYYARLTVIQIFERDPYQFGHSFEETFPDEPRPCCAEVVLGDPAYLTNAYYWEKTILRSDYNCLSDSLTLDYVAKYCNCAWYLFEGFSIDYVPCTDENYPVWYGCKDPPSTVTVTPVP